MFDITNEYFNELLSKMFNDVAWIIIGIILILLIAYIIDFTCRWHDIGERYK